MKASIGLLLAALLAACASLEGQTQAVADSYPRAGLAAGMGVNEMSAPDVVDLINAGAAPSQRVSQFRSAVEFFGSCFFPMSGSWILKAEYAYLYTSTSIAGAFGPEEFGVAAHLPSLILQYVLADKGLYNVKVGAGGGYHFGSLSETYGSQVGTFSGSGVGFLAEMEANTAFGDHLYAFLGANIRWDRIGELRNVTGVSPGVSSAGTAATLHFFGAGARLGMSFLF